MGEYIGIDLGTTNSVVAAVDSSGARVLDNREAKSQTRSVVGLKVRKRKGEGVNAEVLVGDPALDNWLMAPMDTIVSIKRLMGRATTDPEVESVRRSYLYEIVEPANGTSDGVAVRMGGTDYSPIDISAMILRKLKDDAEFRLGRPVTHAVITVPAYFSEVQRDATRKAGVAAGLNVIKLLDEPTAAAVSFGVDTSQSDEPKTILVYDLGGGTFDISILMMAGGILAPLSLMGDMWLGGDNFDQVLVDHVLSLIQKEHGIDATANKRFMVALKKAAKDVKERLSNSQSADLIVAAILQDDEGNPIDVEEEITRGEFSSMIAPLIERTVTLTKKAIEEAKLDITEIDHVLMAGNSTCVPAIQEAMERLFGKDKVLRKDNPKHVVALGAAMVAARTGGKLVCQAPSRDDEERECGHVNLPEAKECEKCGAPLAIADDASGKQQDLGAMPPAGGIAPFCYGVQGAGDSFNIFINKNDPYPTPQAAIQTQTPATMVPNQRMIRLPVYGGDNIEKASRNEKQGEALAILPAGLPKGIKIHVKLWLDGDGIFNLSAHLADGSDLKPRITQGGTDAKAVQALEDVERELAERAGAISASDLHRLDEAKERAYGRMRDGDYSGAIDAAQKCKEQMGKLGEEHETEKLGVEVEQLVRFAEFVMQKYHWILKADPRLQGRLENSIDDVRDAIRRKNSRVIEEKAEQLTAALDDLPDLIHALLGMKGVIASRVKPLNPAVARNLDEELEEMEVRFRRDVQDIENMPGTKQQGALEQLIRRVRSDIHSFEVKIQDAIEKANRDREKGIPCPRCKTEVAPGATRCPNPHCKESLTHLDFGPSSVPSFRNL